MAINIKFRGSNNARTLETYNGRTLYRSYAYSDDLSVSVVSPTFNLELQPRVKLWFSTLLRMLSELFIVNIESAPPWEI